MKKALFVLLSAIIVGSMLLIGCGGAPQEEQGKVYEFTSSLYLPSAHLFTGLQDSWGKEIEKRSAGRVKITFYPAGQLVKAPDTPDAIQKGIADIAFAHIDYNRGRFPVTEALDLPMGYPTGWVGSHVATDFFNKYKPKEWDGFHVLLFNAGTTAGLMTHDKKITKLEDLKGVTLRGAGMVADAINALGATARDISMAEMYDSVSKGVVDGALVGIETLKSFKMGDVCKYTAFAWQPGSMYTFYLAMNKDKWNSLPKDLQKIFNEVSAEWAEKYAECWNQIDIDGINYSLGKGNEVYKLSDSEGKRFKDAVQPVLGKYTDAMVAKGYSKSEVEGWLNYIKSRIEYWTPKEKERGIPSPFDLSLPQG